MNMSLSPNANRTNIGKTFNEDGLFVLLPGEKEDEATEREDYSPAQKAALSWFQENEEALFDKLTSTLQEHVEALEAREQEEVRSNRRTRVSSDALIYGENDNDVLVDEKVRALFDDPEEAYEEEFEIEDDFDDEPFYTRFEISHLVLLPGKSRKISAFGFTGKADWEEEKGLGVIMDGFEVEDIGSKDLVR